MKKIFSVILLLAIFSAMPLRAVQLHDAAQDKYNLTKKIIASESVNMCVETPPSASAKSKEKLFGQTRAMATAAFEIWTADAARKIRESGRADEFKSVITTLEKKFTLSFENCADDKEYDLQFLIINKKDVKKYYDGNLPDDWDTPSHYDGKIEIPDYMLKYPNFSNVFTDLFIFTHEMGHAFGLADQYDGAMNQSFYYTAPRIRKSVMGKGATKLTCDDLDTVITLIDRFGGTKRTFSSLCDDGTTFVNGIAALEKTRKFTVRGGPDVSVWLVAPDFETKGYMGFEKEIVEVWEYSEFLKPILDEKTYEKYYNNDKKITVYIKTHYCAPGPEQARCEIMDVETKEYIFDLGAGKKFYAMVNGNKKAVKEPVKINRKTERKLKQDFPKEFKKIQWTIF